MTSPRASEEPGAEEAPGAATPDSSASPSDGGDPHPAASGGSASHEPTATPEPAATAEPTESAESAESTEAAEAPGPDREEPRPATGIRWSETGDTPAVGGTPSPPVDDDPTPPSGIPAGQTAPGTSPHPGIPHHPPPTGQQTWAPAPPQPDPARRRRVRRLLLAVLIGLVVVAAVVVALLAFLVGPRFARYDVLDRAAVERGVTDVVTRDWHRQVGGVVCPDRVQVRPGMSFECTATVDGRPQQVPVDIVDGNGTYEVGQPR